MAKLPKKAGGYKAKKEKPYFTGKDAEKPIVRELKHDANAYSDELKSLSQEKDEMRAMGNIITEDFKAGGISSITEVPADHVIDRSEAVISPDQMKEVDPYKMDRPIAFIDLETTGTDTNEDRIVEISVLVAYPDGSEEVRTRYINPGIPIPAEATLVHGINDELVANEPPFKAIAKALHEFIDDCDIVGFNSNRFDAPLLYNEFKRAGINWKYLHVNLIDVRNIYTIREPRTLEAAYKFYTGKDLHNAHSAESDIRATKEILYKMLEQYPDLPKTWKELAIYSNHGKPILDISGKFTLDAEGDIIFNFGQHIGKKAKGNKNYLDWMIKGNFSEDTKSIARVAFYNKTITP